MQRACMAPASGSVNQTEPSAPTHTSLGLLKACPCQLSSSGVASPLTTSSATSEPPDLPQPCRAHGEDHRPVLPGCVQGKGRNPRDAGEGGTHMHA